jgi:hypothetical protein
MRNSFVSARNTSFSDSLPACLEHLEGLLIYSVNAATYMNNFGGLAGCSYQKRSLPEKSISPIIFSYMQGAVSCSFQKVLCIQDCVTAMLARGFGVLLH